MTNPIYFVPFTQNAPQGQLQAAISDKGRWVPYMNGLLVQTTEPALILSLISTLGVTPLPLDVEAFSATVKDETVRSFLNIKNGDVKSDDAAAMGTPRDIHQNRGQDQNVNQQQDSNRRRAS